MNNKVLITGSHGLVGIAIATALRLKGIKVLCMDLRGHGVEKGDIRNLEQVRKAVAGVDGIVHLAAVSRVIWGEQNPKLCWETNVDALGNILNAAVMSGQKPWIISASSREVYGQPSQLPAEEDCKLAPVNIYGRSKVAGERLVEEAREKGLRACTIRLSNVFGSTADHADRVVPAFVRAALLGKELRVDGADHTFDFTYIDDVARGIVAIVDLLTAGEAAPPPIHFVTGKATTLGELAQLCIEITHSNSKIRLAEPRNFDVANFFGSPARAQAILGWSPQVSLECGLLRLVDAFREARTISALPEVV